jgi:oligosaccharide repeat unit polymerase
MIPIFLTLTLVVVLLASKLVALDRDYTVDTTIKVSFIVFNIVTPFITSWLGLSFWSFQPNESLYITAIALNALFYLSYTASYAFVKAVRIKRESAHERWLGRNASKKRVYTVLFAILIFQIWVAGFDLETMFIRDHVSESENLGGGRISWLFNLTVLRSAPTVIFIYIFLYRKDSRYRSLDLFIFILSMLLIAPPTLMPRFMAGALYLPVFYFLISRYVRVRYSLILLAGLLVVFPILDVGRQLANGANANIVLVDLLVGNFSAGHLDSFQSTMMAVHYGSFEWGKQLLGAMLFFVPRSIWSEKPIGSGEYLALLTGLDFTNISMSWVGEWYLNFGIVGVVFSGFILATIAKTADSALLGRSGCIRFVFSSLLVPMAVLIMRGDMMSSFSFSIGLLLASCIWPYVVTAGAKNSRTVKHSLPRSVVLAVPRR